MKTFIAAALLVFAGFLLHLGFRFLFAKEPDNDREFAFHLLRIVFMGACLFAGALGIPFLIGRLK